MTQDNKPEAQITPNQVRTAFNAPAVFTNKFYFTHLGPAVRIAFCEEIFEEKNPLYYEAPRTSVIIPVDQFIKFAGEIMTLVNMMQAQQTHTPTENPA